VPGWRVRRLPGRFVGTGFVQSCIRRQCLDCLQGDRDGFLARLGPPQVAIHLGKELVHRRIRQKDTVFARLGLGFAVALRGHRI
jgi:hypothetical protein